MDGDKDKGVVVFTGKKRYKAPRPKTMIHPETVAAKPRRWPKKLAVAIVIILIFWFGIQFVQGRRAPANECSGKKDSQIYKDAAAVLNPGARSKLKKVASRIEKMKRHDKDPSCLAVLVTYYLRSEESDKATKYMDLLNKATSKNEFSPTLGDIIDDKETLNQKVKFLSQRVKALDSGTTGVYRR